MGCCGEVEFFGSVYEDVVDFDEDGTTELDGLLVVIPDVYGGRAAADSRGALVDVDVRGYVGGVGVVCEEVGGG